MMYQNFKLMHRKIAYYYIKISNFGTLNLQFIFTIYFHRQLYKYQEHLSFIWSLDRIWIRPSICYRYESLCTRLIHVFYSFQILTVIAVCAVAQSLREHNNHDATLRDCPTRLEELAESPVNRFRLCSVYSYSPRS